MTEKKFTSKPMKSSKGFTLLETVVVIVLSFLVISLVVFVLRSVGVNVLMLSKDSEELKKKPTFTFCCKIN